MSDQAKLVYLREKINAIIPKERSGWIAFILGLIAAIVGFWIKPLGAENGFAFGILGTIVCIVGFFEVIVYGIIHIRLLKMINQIVLFEQLDFTHFAELKCPNCGEEIPRGNLEVCPSCGVHIHYG
jgi:hypothetical protein